MSVNPLNYTDYIISYEQGELDMDDTVILFEYLYETGILWQLQGSYQRAWRAMQEAGVV